MTDKSSNFDLGFLAQFSQMPHTSRTVRAAGRQWSVEVHFTMLLRTALRAVSLESPELLRNLSVIKAVFPRGAGSEPLVEPQRRLMVAD